MASSGPDNQGIIAGINVTPLVDITLVLLIVFMVTAKVMVTPAVPLELPRASQTENLQAIFSVVVPGDGEILVNGRPAASDEVLVALARQALADAADLRAVINADGAVPHRRVIQVLDLMKRAGIVRVAFGALAADEGAR